jgi:hypothetical protein
MSPQSLPIESEWVSGGWKFEPQPASLRVGKKVILKRLLRDKFLLGLSESWRISYMGKSIGSTKNKPVICESQPPKLAWDLKRNSAAIKAIRWGGTFENHGLECYPARDPGCLDMSLSS